MFIDGNEMYVDGTEYDRYLDALYPGRAAGPRDPRLNAPP